MIMMMTRLSTTPLAQSLTHPVRVAKYCDEHVCLSVCLSVCPKSLYSCIVIATSLVNEDEYITTVAIR